MYESHFGLSGPPFQLIPDPSFYFSSRGHSNALAFLKFGAHQGEGFIVVTGEIGAGKTTLVRTLLEGLDASKVVAAPVVSTQLEAGDLPLAILMSFGVTTTVDNKGQLLADLEAFLTDLSSKGRRALLIVDEAQNLAPEVIEELRLLTNFQLGKNAMLQVFLVGQPELRTMLQSKAMDQLRQRVTASCHLGPLDTAESRAYVQHRLHLVGWNDRPQIELDAFQQLHRWTGGIPRRINRLCNRLLLAAFLEGRDTITAEDVERIAQDLRDEIGETDEVPELGTPQIPAFVSSTTQAPDTASTADSLTDSPPVVPPLDISMRLDAVLSSTPLFMPGGRPAHKPFGEARPLPEAPPLGVIAAHEATSTEGFAVEDAQAAVAQGDAPRADVDVDVVVDIDVPAAPTPVLAARPEVARDNKAPHVAAVRAAAPEPVHIVASTPAATAPAAALTPATPPATRTGPKLAEPLICLVDSAADYVKARALARIFADHPKLPVVMTVYTGSPDDVELGEGLRGVMPESPSDVHLDVDDQGGAASAASALIRFSAVLKVHAPVAVLAMGASDMLLTCSLLAHKCGVPVLRNDAGRRRAWARPGEEMNAVLLERFADISYITDLATYYTLYRVGIPTDRVLCVGDLADNVVRFAADHTVQPDEVLRRANISTAALKHQRGYALATAQLAPLHSSKQDVKELVSRLALVAKELPLLWPVNAHTLASLKESGQLMRLEDQRIVAIPSLGYLDAIDLLRRARCLIAGPTAEFLDEAVSLGVQSLVLAHGTVVPMKLSEPTQLNVAQGIDKLERLVAEMLAVPVARRPVPEFWDGGPAARIATHLETWLKKQANSHRAARQARSAA